MFSRTKSVVEPPMVLGFKTHMRGGGSQTVLFPQRPLIRFKIFNATSFWNSFLGVLSMKNLNLNLGTREVRAALTL